MADEHRNWEDLLEHDIQLLSHPPCDKSIGERVVEMRRCYLVSRLPIIIASDQVERCVLIFLITTKQHVLTSIFSENNRKQMNHKEKHSYHTPV